MLSLSDIRQDEGHDCGLAATRIAVAVFRRRYPKADLGERLAMTDLDGTDPRSIEGFLRQEWFRVQSGNMTIDDLRHHTKLGRPVIVLVSWEGGHYVVVAGVSRGFVYYQDPSKGPGRVKIDDFLKAWASFDRYGATFDNFGIAVWA